jgi:hypothetical protein
MIPVATPATDIQRQLAETIMLLATSAQQCPLTDIVRTIDDIRASAARAGLNQVALLASHLESAIGARGRSAAIASYLDAMGAALDQPNGVDAQTADEAWAALVAVRFAN